LEGSNYSCFRILPKVCLEGVRNTYKLSVCVGGTAVMTEVCYPLSTKQQSKPVNHNGVYMFRLSLSTTITLKYCALNVRQRMKLGTHSI
jgi:hypothetical protein